MTQPYGPRSGDIIWTWGYDQPLDGHEEFRRGDDLRL